MNQGELIPKPRRHWRMKQAPKNEVRRERDVARAELAFHLTPTWWRWWHRAYARVVETDPETAAAMPSMENLTDGT